jgi:SAM-dependent methyltransferase
MPEGRAATVNLGEGTEEDLRHQRRFLKYLRGCRRVVDLGSGVGGFTQRLTRDGVDVICVDDCPEAVRQCRRRGLSAVCADAVEFLAAHPHEFDGIWCAYLVERLRPPKAEQLVRESYAALRGRGVLIILTPNPSDVSFAGESLRPGTGAHFGEDSTYVQPYAAAMLQRMLVAAGFGIEDADEMPVAGLQARGWLKRLAREGRGLVSRALIGRHLHPGDIYVVARKGEDERGC